MNYGKPIRRAGLALVAMLSLSSCSAILESMVDSTFDAAFDRDDGHYRDNDAPIVSGRARSKVSHDNTGSR